MRWKYWTETCTFLEKHCYISATLFWKALLHLSKYIAPKASLEFFRELGSHVLFFKVKPADLVQSKEFAPNVFLCRYFFDKNRWIWKKFKTTLLYVHWIWISDLTHGNAVFDILEPSAFRIHDKGGFCNFPHTPEMMTGVENCKTIQKLHLVVCGGECVEV